MVALWGEVVGTAILIFLGGSVCAGAALKKSFAYNAGWLAIQFAWGLAVIRLLLWFLPFQRISLGDR